MLARYHGEPIAAALVPEKPGPKSVIPTVGFMFEGLTKDEQNRLPEGAGVVAALVKLGEAMGADNGAAESRIPAAYTYFGQFIDHDITLTKFSESVQPNLDVDPITSDKLTPIAPGEIGVAVRNNRTAQLDLDSLYGGDAKIEADGTMALDDVTGTGSPIKTDERSHDLPRKKLDLADPVEDRRALIGDPRNDENLLVAQMHVAFLRSHNVLMKERGLDRDAAQIAIRRRYQWAVLHDFLRRICDLEVIDDVLKNGATAWKPEPAQLFMPIEFAAAAYRFGHSMVRANYRHNVEFNPAPFRFFFTFTALSGDIQPGPGPNGEFDNLPDNWIIEWPRFFSPAGDPKDPGENPARRIDTQLVPDLGELRKVTGEIDASLMGKLAARNLLRGYLLGLPTGQAVADHLGVARVDPKVLLAAVPAAARGDFEKQGLHERTPLWFYVLAEAGDPKGADGQHLGVVGSRIVAETLWTLVKHSQDSVVDNPPTADEIKTGEFTLRGLIKIGQDKGMDPLELPPQETGA